MRRDGMPARQLFAVLLCSAVAQTFLISRLALSARGVCLLSPALFVALLLVLRLAGCAPRCPEAAALLLAANLFAASLAMCRAARFIAHTEFSDIGSYALALAFFLFFLAVFSSGGDAAGRFSAVGAAALAALLLVYAFSAGRAADAAHLVLALPKQEVVLSALPELLLPALLPLPLPLALCDGGKPLHGARSAAALAFVPPALMLLAEAVLGRLLARCTYPFQEAWLCLNTAILQRIDAVVFSGVMLLLLVQLAAHACACRRMLALLGGDSEPRRALLAALAAGMFLAAQRLEAERGMYHAFAAAAALGFIALAIQNGSCRRKGKTDAR